MSIFAKIENNIVTNVIVATQEFINSGALEGEYLETTPGAYGGIVYEEGNPTDKICLRKNCAGIGYTYNREKDVFIAPKPLNSWVLNENTCIWEPPIPKPTEQLNENQYYFWNESIINWEIKQK